MVTCRQAGRGHAAAAVATDVFNRGRESGPGVDTRPVMAGVTCQGHEASLMECDHDEDAWCPGAGTQDVAAVMCTDTQAWLLFLLAETINARPTAETGLNFSRFSPVSADLKALVSGRNWF